MVVAANFSAYSFVICSANKSFGYIALQKSF